MQLSARFDEATAWQDVSAETKERSESTGTSYTHRNTMIEPEEDGFATCVEAERVQCVDHDQIFWVRGSVNGGLGG